MKKIIEKKKENKKFAKPININDLKNFNIKYLKNKAKLMNVITERTIKKQELIIEILKKQIKKNGLIYGEGILEIIQEEFGFLRETAYNYEPSLDDIYIGPDQIKKNKLKSGDSIGGYIRLPVSNKEKYCSIYNIKKINGINTTEMKTKIQFDSLIPLYPNKKFILEDNFNNLSARLIDMFCPIGKGQRALIVSPPKAGKTVLMQNIANSIVNNNPEVMLFVLLIDERPEEVTDMKRNIKGEVIASTFDESPYRHIQVAELLIARAKKLVENKKDIVILLDSITRLGRAYNSVAPPSGKILSGGIDSNALQKPKRFFGSARNIESGGSLTIISTALIETGSKMDEIIFEEFKGTGNSEIVLDRKLTEKRFFPGLDINKSGTRKEEYLIEKKKLNKIFIIRQIMHSLNNVDAIEFIINKLNKTKNNNEFINLIKYKL